MQQFRYKFIRTLSPALTAALLIWSAGVVDAWPSPADANPYHERSKEAVRAIPTQIGRWVGHEVPPQTAAVEILRPNIIRTIEYADPSAAAIRRPERRVWLSIVQCRYAGDMLGHYPPKCYPSYGDTMLTARRRDWSVPTVGAAGLEGKPWAIAGTEYRFERLVDGKSYRRTVYNFMVAPGRGLAPDMKELDEAAEDYRRRYYGTAQVQVVFASLAGQEPSEAERDEIFSTLMQACRPAIEVLAAGE